MASHAARRFASLIERLERGYLLALRAALLLIATGLVIYASWLIVSGTVKWMRSAASVTEARSSVTASEIVPTKTGGAAAPVEDRAAAQATDARRAYDDVLKKYFGLYQQRFETYRQATDKRLTRDEFDDNFLRSDQRVAAVVAGELALREDLADLGKLVETMTAASGDPATTARLKAYKTATKRPVEREVQRTRSETRSGWDRYSTSCADWFYQPYGCATTRTVEVPYTAKVRAMEFPPGTVSHVQIFRDMQDRYFRLLDERRVKARNDAEAARASIALGNEEGRSALWRSLMIAAGFLTVMFLFLLIAIERHQRRLVAAIAARDAGDAPEPDSP